jgi:hypothetical protein
VVAFVHGVGIEGFKCVQRIVRGRPKKASVAAVGDDEAKIAMFRHGAVSCLIGDSFSRIAG